MNDITDSQHDDEKRTIPFINRSDKVLSVEVGRAMPPTGSATLPRLDIPVTTSTQPLASDCSTVAEGMQFVGNALLRGPCAVGGDFRGNLTQVEGTTASVVITETGSVKGDISAQKISVMGRTEGILDAGHGEVSLHDTASVHGVVRYGRIQVNGADLNATLERAPLSATVV